MKLLCFLLAGAFFVRKQTVFGIGINNQVVGEPEVECLVDKISINFNTAEPYFGTVYIKNRRSNGNCAMKGDGGTSTTFTISFDECGASRERTTEPAGVRVKATAVIAFHSLVVTKTDRAVQIQCFYMESEKSDGAMIDASMPTTKFQRATIPMPQCRYEVFQSRENQVPVEFALVGDKVYHKWTCDTDAVDAFCMEIHSCFLDGKNGRRLQLIDEQGCALDGNLLTNLEYPSDLMAGQEAHVFKYADSASISFKCEIRLSAKTKDENCEAFRGDPCPEAPLIRRTRNSALRQPEGMESAFVSSRPFLVGDVHLRNRVHHPGSYPIHVSEEMATEREIPWDQRLTSFCMDVPYYGTLLAVTTLIGLGALSTFLIYCIGVCRHSRKQRPQEEYEEY